MGRPTALSSGAIAPGTVTVAARRSFLNSVSLTGDGTNACTLVVYDNASTETGKILASLRVGAAGATGHLEYPAAVRADNGLTVVVTGTGAVGVITYDAA